MQVLEIPVGQVEVGNRLRIVNMEKVAQIAFSMKEVIGKAPRGQMVPIEVGPAGANGKHPLISGAHRFAAVVESGLPTVKALVYEATKDPDELRLREIDENLYRNDLSPYDFATFIGERARLFEKINGKIKQGGNTKVQVAPLLFTRKTAEALGFSEDTVKRARRRLQKIHPDAWALLKGTVVAENGSYLDALCLLNREQQLSVVSSLKETANFQYALNLVQGRPAGRAKTAQQECNALSALWEKTSPAGQKLFRKLIRRKHDNRSPVEA